MDMLKKDVKEDALQDALAAPKIIFCSRTHSQLSQFVTELKKAKPPSSMLASASNNDIVELESIHQASLGSRKNLCIHPTISRLSSAVNINERCLEVQKPGTPKERKCQFLPTKDNAELVEVFKKHALARPRDIEDTASLGRSLGICPYYSSRAVVAPSEILTLPYPLLLQREAREAMGISVKDNVVIIDEAHNLMDAITETFSISISLQQLDATTAKTIAYAQKFRNKLKGINRVYVTQVIRLLNGLSERLRDFQRNQHTETLAPATEIMHSKGIDQIRPYDLVQYLKFSKLAYKIDTYSDSLVHDRAVPTDKGFLTHFQGFLLVLMNPSAEGRFILSKSGDDICLRYVLLDPREHFRDIVEEARAVVLAGGTMSPMSDYQDHLFSFVPPDRLRTFSFGHVVSPENICVQTIGTGPTNQRFDFTFAHRNSSEIINELGRLVVATCALVPDGVVVFFPSYDYLDRVTKTWKEPGNVESIYARIGDRKRVFEETRGVAVDTLLQEYAASIDAGHGAMLLSVIGGKLSEGINFSDKLGRAVIAVGLPFPNAQTVEWKAKLEYVEQAKLEQLRDTAELSEGQKHAMAKAASREFYENACMRAVNQCIGRAIRHKNDYAAVILVDSRFETDRIKKKLPGWIRDSMREGQQPDSWAQRAHALTRFFAGKR